jgi:RNA polymerase sigma-70 factor (ECF subfamily)
LLDAFVRAASAGDAAALVSLLAADAVLVTDGGAEGRTFGRFRNLRQPLVGGMHVASFVAATSARGGLDVERHELNGRPAIVLLRGGAPFAALLLAVGDAKTQRIYFHADPARLRFLGRAAG